MPDQTNTSTAGTTDPAPGPPTEPSGDKVSGERKPAAAPTNSSTDALKNLKALKATVPALLGGQFLPFPLPPAGGATPPAVFGPQLQADSWLKTSVSDHVGLSIGLFSTWQPAYLRGRKKESEKVHKTEPSLQSNISLFCLLE